MEKIEEIFKRERLTWNNFPLLIVDDEQEFLEDMKNDLKDEFNVFTTSNPSEVLPMIKKHNISVAISDQRMAQKKGIELLSEVKKEFPNVIRILITGYTDYDVAIAGINKGEIYRYIPKKSDMEEKIMLFKQAIELFYLRDDERKTHEVDKALIKSLQEQQRSDSK